MFTTGFFEQDHSAKTKPKNFNWHSNSGNSRSSRRTEGTARPKPVSAETKSKLDAFAFKKGSSKNNSTKVTDKADPPQGQDVGEDGETESVKASPIEPHTPAPRLALSDLMSLAEPESPLVDIDSAVPEEKIAWQPSPRSTPFPATQRSAGKRKSGRSKRASSSSPISSPRHLETPIPSRTKQPFDLNTLGRNLKTPNADPASDLWTRYSSTNISAQELPSLPAINRLFTQNTDQRRPGRSPLGLRRAHTCGAELPRSKIKRRRLDEMELDEPAEARERSSAAGSGTGHSKLSRVSKLVGQMHANLSSRPFVDFDNISSSSPLPSKSDRDYDPPSSPTNHLSRTTTAHAANAKPHTATPAGQVLQMPGSDDFGDFGDDFDMEMLEEVDEIVARSQQPPTKSVSSPTPLPPPPLFSALSKSNTRTVQEFDDSDEFGVDEFGGDEGLDEDLEGLLQQYDELPNEMGSSSAVATGHAPAIQEEQVQESMVIVEDDDEDYGDVDFDDLDEEALNMTNGLITTNHSSYIRLRVTSEDAREEEWKPGHKQKVFTAKNKETGKEYTVILRQDWFATEDIREHDKVHIIGQPHNSSEFIIDNDHNLLVMHPDHLISSTVVADSFSCLRRSVFQDRIKATSETSKPMVYGNLLHELLQMAMMENDFSDGYLHKQIEILARKRLEEFYFLQLDLESATEYLRSKVGLIQDWQRKFIGIKPKIGSAVMDHRSPDQPRVAVQKLLDVEEHVWSPKYGLKGNIDATLQVAIDDAEGSRVLTVPFELKTGRSAAAMNHRAQTMLYTLLLSDRYDIDIMYGLLHYLEKKERNADKPVMGDTIRVKGVKDELRHMIIQRNEVARYAVHRQKQPPLLNDSRVCKNCYSKSACFTYYKALEDGQREDTGVPELFDEITSHMTEPRKKYFQKWEELITKEERSYSKHRKEIWTVTSEERQSRGTCFAGMQLVPGSTTVSQAGAKINRFQYTLVRKPNSSTDINLREAALSEGDPIVISDEKGHYALAIGYLTTVTSDSIVVQVDRRLHNSLIKEEGFDSETNQAFSGLKDLTGCSKVHNATMEAGRTFRVDKDEWANGVATLRNNLVQLFDNSDDKRNPRRPEILKRLERLRQLVVDYKEPKFSTIPTQHSIEASHLNEDQRSAIDKVMRAEDYALVLGMPGTGKTTTIAEIIRALVRSGKSILLTAYTHLAVDNILLKLKNDNIKILRVGNSIKIHDEVKDFVELTDVQRGSFDELDRALKEPQIVATTCLGINHLVFGVREFDYCIVDEASQLQVPTCLGPLRFADKFILVGDHYQLAPLCRNDEAKEGGLNQSLFQILADKYESAMVSLSHQYRMSEDIMSLSNEIVYSGKMHCGSSEIAKQTLKLPNPGALHAFHSATSCTGSTESSCWISHILSQSVRACFLNTDSLPAPESYTPPEIIENATEAVIIRQAVESLLACGIQPGSIGVISIFNSQLKRLRNTLKAALPSNAYSKIEILSVDKSQGRDKDVILLSFCRSNDHGASGELLKDWRRINVAITRAKKKMILVGSKGTLSKGSKTLDHMLRIMGNKGWIYDLPPGAHDVHEPVDVAATTPSQSETQVSSSPRARSPRSKKAKPGKENLSPRSSPKSKNKKAKVPEKKGNVSGTLINRPGVLKDIRNEIMG